MISFRFTSVILTAGFANKRKSVIRVFSLSDSLIIISIRCLLSPPNTTLSFKTCTDPLIDARGFLTSCAMPAASSPSALNLSALLSCSSISLSLVKSWNIII